MSDSFFTVSHVSSKSKARRGVITTDHGAVQTPAFVSVATKGTLKSLMPPIISEIGTQLSFVNTYHLVTHPGSEIIAKAGGIQQFSRLNYPLMSDSGGFQVFSLGKNARKTEGDGQKTIKHLQADVRGEEVSLLLKITEDGVLFRSIHDGATIEFTPEKSINYQKQIGADLIMAFDECTYYPATFEYSTQSMERTHAWLLRCITQMKDKTIISSTKNQHLYGIIQGATYEELRKQSAEFVTKQDVDGIAIGGVSVGEHKQEMRDQVKWVSEYLPANKPVHLLGVGELDDILELVRYGVDTFDCVEPTRLARMGTIYQWESIKQALETMKQSDSGIHFSELLQNYKIDITKGIYKADLSAFDTFADNYVTKNFTKSYVHHLFKQKELLGYELATFHNLWVMEELMKEIRALVESSLI